MIIDRKDGFPTLEDWEVNFKYGYVVMNDIPHMTTSKGEYAFVKMTFFYIPEEGYDINYRRTMYGTLRTDYIGKELPNNVHIFEPMESLSEASTMRERVDEDNLEEYTRELNNELKALFKMCCARRKK